MPTHPLASKSGYAMDRLVLIVGLLCYLTKAMVVVRRHFSSATTPREVRFGIIASYVGLAAFIYLMLRDKHAIAALVAALAIFVASLALFLWAAKIDPIKGPETGIRPPPWRADAVASTTSHPRSDVVATAPLAGTGRLRSR